MGGLRSDAFGLEMIFCQPVVPLIHAHLTPRTRTRLPLSPSPRVQAASEVEAGHLVLDGEVERTQRQHLDDVVASLGAVPGLAEALSDVAIHSKNPPRLAQACRDVAYEVNGLASFATNLAAATGDLAHQQALISRAKEYVGHWWRCEARSFSPFPPVHQPKSSL